MKLPVRHSILTEKERNVLFVFLSPVMLAILERDDMFAKIY